MFFHHEFALLRFSAFFLVNLQLLIFVEKRRNYAHMKTPKFVKEKMISWLITECAQN